MTAEARLATLYAELRRLGFRALVMGGHAVRFYGIDRSTIDNDLTLAVTEAQWRMLPDTLRQSPLLSAGPLREGTSWRPQAFRRFVVGALPDGREERLELWRYNHLLAPFDELDARRVEGAYGGLTVAFLGIDDLIHSKETERDDDWRDVALLEEIADERRFVAIGADDEASAVSALSQVRSRKGFAQLVAAGRFDTREVTIRAVERVTNPMSAAYLAPYAAGPVPAGGWTPSIAGVLGGPLRNVVPASGRHLALVEAVRRLYRRSAMERDRADKERAARE